MIADVRYCRKADPLMPASAAELAGKSLNEGAGEVLGRRHPDRDESASTLDGRMPHPIACRNRMPVTGRGTKSICS